MTEIPGVSQMTAAEKLAAQRDAQDAEHRRLMTMLTERATACGDCGRQVIVCPAASGFPITLEATAHRRGWWVVAASPDGGDLHVRNRKGSRRPGFDGHLCPKTHTNQHSEGSRA